MNHAFDLRSGDALVLEKTERKLYPSRDQIKAVNSSLPPPIWILTAVLVLLYRSLFGYSSHELPRKKFSSQYQYNINQTGDESYEKYVS